MTVEELVKDITEWVTRETFMDGMPFGGDRHAAVHAHALLEHIVEVSGIERDLVIKWAADVPDNEAGKG